MGGLQLFGEGGESGWGTDGQFLGCMNVCKIVVTVCLSDVVYSLALSCLVVNEPQVLSDQLFFILLSAPFP